MALSDNEKEILNKMNRRAAKVALGTVIQNLQNGVLPSGSISTSEIADDAVDNDKIADSAVDTDQLADDAVDNDKIADSAVDSDQLAADAVNGDKIADGAISFEHLDSGIVPMYRCIEAVSTATMSREDNIAGLSSAIALANALKATVNVHYADFGVSGEEHATEDTAIASADADSLVSLITLTSEIQDSYVAHDADAALGSPVFHQAQTSANSLASAVNPADLEDCVSVLNDIKAKLNLHMADSTSHSAGDSPAEAEDDAAFGAANLVAVPGAISGDVVVFGIVNSGSGSVEGVSAVASTDEITFTFSADPQNDAIISYIIFRLAS